MFNSFILIGGNMAIFRKQVNIIYHILLDINNKRIKIVLTELRIVENIFSLKINVREPKNRHPKDIRPKTNFLVDKTVLKLIILSLLLSYFVINMNHYFPRIDNCDFN